MKPKALKDVRYALDFPTRLLGLMGHKAWPASHRGLFFPRCRAVHTFFTFLRPDLVFVDKNQKILKIFPSAAPGKIYWGSREDCHCLELPEGSAERFHLSPGDRLQIESTHKEK